MGKRRTPEEFDADLAAVTDQVIRIGPYKGQKENVLCKCLRHGEEHLVKADNLLRRGTLKCCHNNLKEWIGKASEVKYFYYGKIVSREEAQAKGLQRFFTGKPCKHGHVEERNTARGSCYACLRERDRRASQIKNPKSDPIVPDFPVYGPFINVKQAREQGLKHYFTGKPCPHGHIDLRNTNSSVCMECARINAMKNYVHKDPVFSSLESINQLLSEKKRDDVMVVEWKGYGKKSVFKCMSCAAKFESDSGSVVHGGVGCKVCSRKRASESISLTKKQVEERLAGRNITMLGKYKTMHIPIAWRCDKCSLEWTTTPGSVIGHAKTGCPKCSKAEAGLAMMLTKEQVQQQITDRDPNILMIGDYLGDGMPTTFRCLLDGHEWETQPTHVKRNTGCPLCAELRGGTDSLAGIISGKIRSLNDPTSFYAYHLRNYPGYIKFGIANDIIRRANESRGEYGELISSWEFSDRIQALAVEMVVLQDTLSHYKKPAKLRKNYWQGITEVRKIDEQEAVDYVQSVVDEMTVVGPLAFLHARLVMSDEERRELEALMRDAPATEEPMLEQEVAQ